LNARFKALAAVIIFSEKIITAAKALNLAFKYIDDVQSINN
jgi:hypothetical protein